MELQTVSCNILLYATGFGLGEFRAGGFGAGGFGADSFFFELAF